LQKLSKSQFPLLVYGHFNRDHGFGVEQYYPEVNQFMTMLRDPFEAAISMYYFHRKVGGSSMIDQKHLRVIFVNI